MQHGRYLAAALIIVHQLPAILPMRAMYFFPSPLPAPVGGPMPAAYEAEIPWWPCVGVFKTSGGSFYRGLGVSVVGSAVNVLALQHRKTRHQQPGTKAATAPKRAISNQEPRQ